MNGTRALLAAVLLASSACPRASVSGVVLEPLRISTERLGFDDTFVGFSSERTISIAVPGKTSREVTASLSGPFEGAARVRLPGSETAEYSVVFRPSAVGDIDGRLELIDLELQQTFVIDLTGHGLAVPDCHASTPCVSSRFELSARGCVETALPDDSPCTSALSCFARASCVAGACRGTTVTCADDDPCTLDVCSDLGCGHVDGTPYCPTSTNPCLVQTCSRDAGCGFAEVPDGTACGERSCTTAFICVAGTCMQRTPPKTQSCADVLVGVPAGRGFVDGRASDARFTFIQSIAVQGEDVLVVDDARVRHLRRGNLVTVAGRSPSVGIVDGLGAQASLGQRASLAPTTTPGLFFLGDGPTIRLVSTRGVVSTLAGRPDAGGAVDGIGAAARVSVSSPLTPGGAGARWVQVPETSLDLTPLLVREVSASGVVRTLASFDLTTLPTIDAGLGEFWDVFSTGVAQGDPLSAWVMLSDPSRTALAYELSWSDAGVRVRPAAEDRRWSNASTTIRQDSCRLRFESDAGQRSMVFPSCITSATFDGERTAYVGAGEAVFSITQNGVQVLAGPVPDRRFADGDRDAGRVFWPRSLSVAPEGVYLLDSSPSLTRARLLRLGPSGVRALLETVDAGLTFEKSLAFHQGQLWLNRDDNFGRVTVLDPSSGSILRRIQSSVPNLGTLRSNGSQLRSSLVWFYELSEDGGVRRLPGVTNVQVSTPGPSGSWYVFGMIDPNDGGSALGARRLFRVEADESLSLVAGDATQTADVDGPALAAGISSMQGLTVAADGTVYFLGANNRLRQLRNGQVTTLMTLSDTPLDLVALADGSLIVAVDAALLRVLP